MVVSQENLFLDSIKEKMPKKPYTMVGKGAKMFITNLEKAIKNKYIQYNQPNSLAFMVFDLDYKTAILAHEKADVLTPSFYVVDKNKTTAHCCYVLENPVHRNEHSKQSPQRLFATIEEVYGERLKADPGYSGLIMKSPWFEQEHHFYAQKNPYNRKSMGNGGVYRLRQI